MTKTYTVQEVDPDGTTTDVGDPVSRLDKAKDLATEHHADIEGSKKVQVVTETGHVSLEIEPVSDDSFQAEVEELIEAETAADDAKDEVDAAAAAVATASRRSKPWTRTDEADYAPEVPGYTLAYKRERTKVAIYRADDKHDWLILDTRDGTEYHSVNTEEGRQITNRLTKEHTDRIKKERDEMLAQRRADRDAKKRAAEQAKLNAAAEKTKAIEEKARDKDGASA